MRVILLISAVISLTFQPSQKVAGQAIDSVRANTENTASFLDSIAKNYELSIAQIKTHTGIDSNWYVGRHSDAGFTGDTIFHINRKMAVGIIEYNDRLVCIYKFLLVFIPPDWKNTATKIVYTDCDRDESANYTTSRFKLLNDSTFETIETYFSANSEKPKSVEIHKWKINDSGKIYSIR